MWVFGSDCYTYSHEYKKLDPRSEKGIFVGYSRNNPVYLIYNHIVVKYQSTDL